MHRPKGSCSLPCIPTDLLSLQLHLCFCPAPCRLQYKGKTMQQLSKLSSLGGQGQVVCSHVVAVAITQAQRQAALKGMLAAPVHR